MSAYINRDLPEFVNITDEERSIVEHWDKSSELSMNLIDLIFLGREKGDDLPS